MGDFSVKHHTLFIKFGYYPSFILSSVEKLKTLINYCNSNKMCQNMATFLGEVWQGYDLQMKGQVGAFPK